MGLFSSQPFFDSVRRELAEHDGHLIDYARIPHVPVRLDTSYVAKCSLASSLTKKLVPSDPATLTQTREKALNLFKDMNLRCEDEVLDSDLVREMRRISEQEFPQVMNWADLLDQSGLLVGPGASVSSRGQNSCFEKFFVNEMTTTNPWLYCEYMHYIQKHASFYFAEKYRRSLRGHAFKVVVGSNISTVPKNDRIDRTICTEPSLNMLFQRSLGEHFNRVLSRGYGYSASLQPDRNRELARLGSLHNSCGTIDLSSASDTISMSLIRQILPKWVVMAIEDCRCSTTICDGEEVHLNMVSTMGNGFTFPLQTYVFSLMIKALCRLKNKSFKRYDGTTSYHMRDKTLVRYEDFGLFGVFGDDIIVPTDLFEDTLEALRSLRFIPNKEKSFGSGYFRESCGSDWYDGEDVRGVYIKTLDIVQDRFSAFNRLLRFSAKHKIEIDQSLALLLPTGWRRFTVPSDCADDCGIKAPSSHCGRYPNKYGVFVYQVFTPAIRPFRIWDLEGKMKRSHDNPYGIMIAACVSSVSKGLARRAKTRRYFKIKACAPFWERESDFVRFNLGFQAWERAFARVCCYLNS